MHELEGVVGIIGVYNNSRSLPLLARQHIVTADLQVIGLHADGCATMLCLQCVTNTESYHEVATILRHISFIIPGSSHIFEVLYF